MGKLRWLKAISLRCVFADLAYFTAGGRGTALTKILNDLQSGRVYSIAKS